MSGENGADEFKNGTNGINNIKVKDPKKLDDFKNGLKESNGGSADGGSDKSSVVGNQEELTDVLSEQEKSKTKELSKACNDSLAVINECLNSGNEMIKAGKVKKFEEIMIKMADVKKKGVTVAEKEDFLRPEITKANQKLGQDFKEWEAAEKEKKQKEKKAQTEKKWMEIQEKYHAGTIYQNEEGDTIKIAGFKNGSVEAHYDKKGSKETIKRVFRKWYKIDELLAGYTRMENESEKTGESITSQEESQTEPENQEPGDVTPERTVEAAEAANLTQESGELFSEKEKEILDVYKENIIEILEDIKNKDYVKIGYPSEKVGEKIAMESACAWNQFKEYMINEKQFNNDDKAVKAWEMLRKEIG